MKSNHETRKIRINNVVLWGIFLFSLTVVLISLVSVVFPALIAANNSTITELKELGIQVIEIDPYVTGVWALPLIVTNIIVFILAILYFKKKLPNSIKRPIEFVFSFEISKKMAFIAIAILLAFFVLVSVGDVTTEEEWEDYPPVKERVENWSPEGNVRGSCANPGQGP